MKQVWVIGSSGLLGSAMIRMLKGQGCDLFEPSERIAWRQESMVDRQMAAAVQEFANCAGSGPGWEIYWAAGIGTMGSSDADLALETRMLGLLLRTIESIPDLVGQPGALAFASSAGAIYAGSRGDVIDERMPVAPTTPYARAKLAQEDLLRAFAQTHQKMSVLLARMTTIYGPGQANGKQQGLLAHMARSIVRNHPIQIYVPFDTIRDYLFVDDAAATVVVNLRALNSQSRVKTRIVAAEQPTTIAEIVSVFKKLARRAPRIATSASKLGALYSRRVQFRSVETPKIASPSRTTLLIGIAQLLAAERAAFASGANKRGR